MNSQLRLLGEEESFRVFFKPPAMHSVSIGASVNSCVSIYESLYPADCAKFRYMCADSQIANEVGLLYRLDYPTSGMVLFMKTPDALMRLRRASVLKTYIAHCSSSPVRLSGLFSTSEYEALSYKLMRYGKLTFKSRFRPYMGKAVRPVLESEVSHYRSKNVTGTVYETFMQIAGDASECVCKNDSTRFLVNIRRGFRHQIRCVLASLMFPIDGDAAYGGAVRDGAREGIGLVLCRLRFSLDGKSYDVRLSG